LRGSTLASSSEEWLQALTSSDQTGCVRTSLKALQPIRTNSEMRHGELFKDL